MPSEDTQHGGEMTHEPEKGEIVTISYAADLDREQVKEDIDEMHPDADYVNVRDRTTGRDVALRGTRPQIVCPKCGEEAYGLRSSGGERVYSHAGTDNCTVRDDDWEPPRGHPEEDVLLKTRAKRAIPHVVSFGIVMAIAWAVLSMLPSGAITINGETATFSPENFAVVALIFVALAALIAWAIHYAPGRVSGRGGRW